ncbi:aminotransferase class V-fold PLP-dependent enzyme [Conexibacter sp. DBS9H8]|uniref:pyridoxal phosphate-dependent decarboxylase family protein n=1 Tax=Conexibacter sp. DBS9H8 TaxID=2937801 RepID=UPI00200F6698|nr:aminotransferase class V-fold PLP-dependent enzyme [Conexibacter sp. DBS9H8]
MSEFAPPASPLSPPLGLAGADAIALGRLSQELATAWDGFRRAREVEPAADDALRTLLAEPLPEHGRPLPEAIDAAMSVLDRSLAQSRPRYFGFVGGSGLESGVLADALAESFDINLAAWSAAASELESQAIGWLADFIGFPAADGHFTSGGTISNVTALAAARQHLYPDVRTRGLAGRPVAVYCSAEAHASVVRAVELLGIGRDFTRALPQRADRGVDPAAVAAAIAADRAAGIAPMAVVATAGTTLTGAIDPIDELADIAADHGVWLHVDGAYGAPAAAIPRLRAHFAGLERADSLTVDPHKWLYLPKACGAVLVRDPAVLEATFGHPKSYMPDEEELPNAVDHTLEYSRPFRALKFWLAFRVHGAERFRAAIEQNLAHAQLLYDLVAAHPRLAPLTGPPSLSVLPFQHLPADPAVDIDEHNRQVTRRLQQDGHVWVASAVVDGATAIRPCFVNFRTTDADVHVLVDEVLRVGAALGG